MRTLKNIFKVILTIILSYAIFFIWDNQEKIATIGYNLINANRKIVMQEPNEHKRYYNYEAYKLEEDFIPQNKEDLINIVYNYLNNGWEEFTFYCPKEYKKCMDDMMDISNDSNLLSAINNYISPYNSFTNIFTKISSDQSITLSKVKTYPNDVVVKLEEKINSIMKNQKLDNLTTKKKIKKLHDYLIKTVEYDKDENSANTLSANAYGALFTGKSICSGYADAMALFLDKLEIPNFKLASETHVWNVALIDNKWYHIDVTWDDPINAITSEVSDTYLLINTKKLLSLDSEEHNIEYELYKEIKKESN